MTKCAYISWDYDPYVLMSFLGLYFPDVVCEWADVDDEVYELTLSNVMNMADLEDALAEVV